MACRKLQTINELPLIGKDVDGSYMSDDIRVDDATSAEFAARRYLESQYPGKAIEVKFSKIWFVGGKGKDVWEVEGLLSMRKAAILKDRKSFRFQIDAETGDVIGFESVRKG